MPIAADRSYIQRPRFPATSILTVAEHLLAAKVAQARGDHAAMTTRFEQAIFAEDALPHMQPGFWSCPS